MTGATIGVAVAYALKAPPLVLFSSVITGAAGNFVGGPVGALIASCLGAEFGKLISKETTFFEVEKQKDGTIILYPKTDLSQKEISIYKNKVAFISLKKGIRDLKKGLITKIDNDFWAGV